MGRTLWYTFICKIMAIVNVVQVRKEFVVRTLFSDISFEIGPKDHIGLIGVNGCGKTTLMNMILGEVKPDAGYISVASGTVIAHVEQIPSLNGDVTLFAFVLEAFSSLIETENELSELAEAIHRTAENRDRRILRQEKLMEAFQREGGLTYKNMTRSTLLGLGFLEEELTKPITLFSGGQVAKAMLARAILRKADLLLLDEPTNNLDVGAICYLQDFLAAYKGAYLLVSHDRAFLDASTNRILELENGKVLDTRGNYSRHLELKMDEREIARKHYAQTVKEIKRIEGIIDQQRRWNQARNYVTIASKEKQIERLREGLVPPEKDPSRIHFHFRGTEPTGNEVIVTRDLGKAYDGVQVFSHADLLVWKGETLCVIGANGCGKSTLLKILTGSEEPTGGTYKIGAGVRLGYFEQNADNLTPEYTIFQEMQESFVRMLPGEIRNYLGAFLFQGDDIYKKIGDLSGGERARIKLLKLVLGGANVLLLDEPTNHFDIASCEVLEKALESFEGTVLIVTHDRYLVNRMADRVALLTPTGFIEQTEEGQDLFSLVRGPAAAKGNQSEKENKDNFYRRQKEQKAAAAMAKQQVAQAEKNIEANENEGTLCEKEIALAEQRGEYEHMQALCEKLAGIQDENGKLYEALERAEQAYAAFEGGNA